MNDGSRRLLLLRVFTHQLFVDPETYRMIIRLGQDRTLRMRLELLNLCRHRENCRECAQKGYNINVTLQEENARRTIKKRLNPQLVQPIKILAVLRSQSAEETQECSSRIILLHSPPPYQGTGDPDL